MQFSDPITVKEISDLIDADYYGVTDATVTGINEIHMLQEGDLTFVDHPKYYDRALNSVAQAIIIDKKVSPPEGKTIFVSDTPFRDYNYLVKHFAPFQPSQQPISDSAQIDKSSIIQPNVFIGHNVEIGKNCIIHPNVAIYNNTKIGDNVIIQSGAIIGSDAFYYKAAADASQNGQEKYLGWHSCGRTVIEDDVEIGAACTIDRGVSGDTFIGQGTKMDNLIHIGHDTSIGRHCLFAAQVGVAGVVNIEDHVILWGQVGVSKDITIGEGAVVLASSGVSKSLEKGKVYFGAPAVEARQKWREMAAVRNLPDLWKKMTSG